MIAYAEPMAAAIAIGAFAVFVWALRWHFASAPVPLGMWLVTAVSVCTLIAFLVGGTTTPPSLPQLAIGTSIHLGALALFAPGMLAGTTALRALDVPAALAEQQKFAASSLAEADHDYLREAGFFLAKEAAPEFTAMTARTSVRLTDRIGQLLPGMVYRKATTQAEKAEVYALRYRSCLREGAILPSVAQCLSDRFDDRPNGQTFSIYLNDKLCGSVRIHVVSRQGDVQNPAKQALSHILSNAVGKGEIIFDPNRLTVDQDASRTQPELAYVVLRLPFISALHFGADLVTATVRPEQKAFYRRVLRFEVTSPARSYPALLTPLSLMTAHLLHELGEVQRRYPLFNLARARERLCLDPQTPVCGRRASILFQNPTTQERRPRCDNRTNLVLLYGTKDT